MVLSLKVGLENIGNHETGTDKEIAHFRGVLWELGKDLGKSQIGMSGQRGCSLRCDEFKPISKQC